MFTIYDKHINRRPSVVDNSANTNQTLALQRSTKGVCIMNRTYSSWYQGIPSAIRGLTTVVAFQTFKTTAAFRRVVLQTNAIHTPSLFYLDTVNKSLSPTSHGGLGSWYHGVFPCDVMVHSNGISVVTDDSNDMFYRNVRFSRLQGPGQCCKSVKKCNYVRPGANCAYTFIYWPKNSALLFVHRRSSRVFFVFCFHFWQCPR